MRTPLVRILELISRLVRILTSERTRLLLERARELLLALLPAKPEASADTEGTP